MKNKKNYLNNCYLIFLLLLCYSCSDSVKDNEYDPNKPIVIDSFYPEEGGMATKVILSGQNLGNDPTRVKVYFNKKLAPVIGCNDGKILVVTPRQPGEDCTISVVLDKDSVVAPKQYAYHIRTVVTTLVGQKGVSAFKAGSFAEATLANPSTLAVDNEGNLFLSMWGGDKNGSHVFINQQKREVSLLANDGPYGAPGTDYEGKVVMVPSDGGDQFYIYDPATQWIPKKRQLIHPTTTEIQNGSIDFSIDYKHSIVSNSEGSYTKAFNGQLIKFDPVTRKGQREADLMPSASTYMAFHPDDENLLFLAYNARHCIYTYNLKTKEHKLFAGTLGTAGWKDGKKEDALFNNIYQLVFDINKNLIIADGNNHCIRQISPDGIVTTLIGMPGKSGYQDGNPDDAQFNNPRGLCIDKDYNIFIADFSNNCVRKLSVE